MPQGQLLKQQLQAVTCVVLVCHKTRGNPSPQ